MDEEMPYPRTVGRLPKLLFSLASVYVTDERANMYPGGFSEEERKTVGYKKSTCIIRKHMVNFECCENEMVLCYEVY